MSGSSQLLYLSIKRVIKQIVAITGAYHFCQLLNKILSNILLSRLAQYAEEIIGDHQCGFRRSRLPTDHIFCIRQILGKKCDYNEAARHLLVDFKKAYDSVREKVLCKFLIEFGIPMKLARLIKLCQDETYNV
jgi:hypothetical protein